MRRIIDRIGRIRVQPSAPVEEPDLDEEDEWSDVEEEIDLAPSEPTDRLVIDEIRVTSIEGLSLSTGSIRADQISAGSIPASRIAIDPMLPSNRTYHVDIYDDSTTYRMRGISMWGERNVSVRIQNLTRLTELYLIYNLDTGGVVNDIPSGFDYPSRIDPQVLLRFLSGYYTV